MRSVSEANRQKQEKGQRNLAQAGRQVRIAAAFDCAAAPVAYLECLFRQCIGSDHGIFTGIAGA